MKRLLFLSTLLIFCFYQIGFAQEEEHKLYIIELSMANESFVNEFRLDLSPGDSFQFKRVEGDFAIYIINAISFLSIEEPDLKILVNAENPESKIYTVQEPIDQTEFIYSIYCTTIDTWPSAPPRIIIATH